MAAITQFDPYSVLARKIGYSVGLEHLQRNVEMLVHMYVRERRLTNADWVELVTSESGYGRKPSAADHFANVYLALGLIRKIGRELHSLHRLDCLAILRRLIADDKQFSVAVQFAMCIAVMESDGDIFLNALSESFDIDRSCHAIQTCLESKWAVYSRALPGRGGQARLWDQLRIKSFKMQNTRADGGRKLAVRTEPIDSALRQLKTQPQEYKLTVPRQYLEKALPPRKGWAQDFGLVASTGERNERSEILFSQLASLGLMCSGSVVFWPYEHELNAIKIDPEKIGQGPLRSWNVLSAVARAWGSKPSKRQLPDEELTSVIVRIFEEYRAGDVTKQLLRQQLPLFLLYPAYIALCVGRGMDHNDVPTFLDKMYKAPERRFNFVAIRGTEGGVQVKKS